MNSQEVQFGYKVIIESMDRILEHSIALHYHGVWRSGTILCILGVGSDFGLSLRPRSGFFDALIPQYESSIDEFELSTQRMQSLLVLRFLASVLRSATDKRRSIQQVTLERRVLERLAASAAPVNPTHHVALKMAHKQQFGHSSHPAILQGCCRPLGQCSHLSAGMPRIAKLRGLQSARGLTHAKTY